MANTLRIVVKWRINCSCRWLYVLHNKLQSMFYHNLITSILSVLVSMSQLFLVKLNGLSNQKMYLITCEQRRPRPACACTGWSRLSLFAQYISLFCRRCKGENRRLWHDCENTHVVLCLRCSCIPKGETPHSFKSLLRHYIREMTFWVTSASSRKEARACKIYLECHSICILEDILTSRSRRILG